MKRTFTTLMPDKVGAFLDASRIFTGLGLNITRVSYNKAVDSHMLFLEAEGEQAALDRAGEALRGIGYLQSDMNMGRVILIEFRLRDRPGVVQPVLQLISSFRFNISYISSQADGTDYQNFRMGLFVENGADISQFLRQASALCAVKILEYDPSGIALDNTVFYMSFANQIAERIGLSEEEKRSLIVNSNLVMELLTQRSSPPYKTFGYIGQFAEQLLACRGEAYVPRVTRYALGGDVRCTLLEPPCGSNLCVLEAGQTLLCVDSGLPCFREESLAWLRKLVPEFGARKKALLLTHADADHVGLADEFDEVWCSRKCFDNFVSEHEGRDNLREENPLHAPYVRISKLLAGYRPPNLDRLRVLGGGSAPVAGVLERIGEARFGPLAFEAYEGAGGHVRGETVYLERTLGIAFTGDILVNLKGFTKPQAAFNRLAPYLMTSVDTDPALAAREREAICGLLDGGRWRIFGGHGAPMEYGGTQNEV